MREGEAQTAEPGAREQFIVTDGEAKRVVLDSSVDEDDEADEIILETEVPDKMANRDTILSQEHTIIDELQPAYERPDL